MPMAETQKLMQKTQNIAQKTHRNHRNCLKLPRPRRIASLTALSNAVRRALEAILDPVQDGS